MKACHRTLIVGFIPVNILLSIFLSLEVKCSEEKEFDWKSLLNIPPSPTISSSIQYQNINGNGMNEEIIQQEAQVQASSVATKLDEKNLRRNQMKNESKKRKKVEKQAFLNNLPENERLKEISKLKEIKRIQYQSYKLKMGSKTRYKYLLDLSKTNLATKDQLKQLNKLKEMNKLRSRRSRLKKKDNKKQFVKT